jgi:hypothetical protein
MIAKKKSLEPVMFRMCGAPHPVTSIIHSGLLIEVLPASAVL